MLTLIPLFLLPYSVTTQALSATTAKFITGSEPYLTFDNGVTKVTTTDDLLGITISDGTNQTTYTPANNPSSSDAPIVLLKENQSIADIGMSLPTNTDSIALNDLIRAPYNYWGDDDGDGQGTNGISATGNLSVRIYDRWNSVVSRNATLDICQSPYRVVLTSTDSNLTTQYGVPNSRSFSGGSTTYYIMPKVTKSLICYVTPEDRVNSSPSAPMPPANMWSQNKGYLMQSIESSTYNRNFPTTGANGLYFDLNLGGIKASTLTWTAVTQGDITATFTHRLWRSYEVRVTLNGPAATASQINPDCSASPSSVIAPRLPQQFEIIAYDSNHTEVLRYGFVLRQWVVDRGTSRYCPADKTSSWCNSLGGGYRLPHVKELTNASGGAWIGASPPTNVNYSNRYIGAGFFSEWGTVSSYDGVKFTIYNYWTGDRDGSKYFTVDPGFGRVESWSSDTRLIGGLCIYP